MKSCANRVFFAAVATLPLLAAVNGWAQALPVGVVGSGTNLSSVMYFEPPNEQLMKMRLTGAGMSPLPGAMYDVRQLKIEKFDLGGKLEAVVQAPRCIYAPLDEVASSSGHLDLTLGNGKIHLQGEGFLWQQSESRLTISNQVSTVIKMGTWQLTTP